MVLTANDDVQAEPQGLHHGRCALRFQHAFLQLKRHSNPPADLPKRVHAGWEKNALGSVDATYAGTDRPGAFYAWGQDPDRPVKHHSSEQVFVLTQGC